MSIYVIGGQKGGTGKSTVATNLAVALTRAGRDLIVVDGDAQRTVRRWLNRREADDSLSPIHWAEGSGKLYAMLADYSRRYTDVILDVGGHDSIEMRTALAIADHLYSPVQASQPDLETLLAMNDLVREARDMNPKLRAHVLLNRIPSHPASTDVRDALDLMPSFDAFDVCETIIRDRKVFKDAMFFGKGVLEMTDPKAASEIDHLCQELRSHAQDVSGQAVAQG